MDYLGYLKTIYTLPRANIKATQGLLKAIKRLPKGQLGVPYISINYVSYLQTIEVTSYMYQKLLRLNKVSYGLPKVHQVNGCYLMYISYLRTIQATYGLPRATQDYQGATQVHRVCIGLPNKYLGYIMVIYGTQGYLATLGLHRPSYKCYLGVDLVRHEVLCRGYISYIIQQDKIIHFKSKKSPNFLLFLCIFTSFYLWMS